MRRTEAAIILGGLFSLALIAGLIGFIRSGPNTEPRVPTAAEYVMCERALRGAAYATDSLAIKRLHPTDDGPSCGDVLEYGHKGAWPREGEPFTSTAP